MFLGIIFFLAVGIVEAQQREPFLHVLGSEGFDGNANVGDALTVTFRAGFDGKGQAGIPLYITTTPNIKVTSPVPVPDTHMTGFDGLLTVKGTLVTANTLAQIRAIWRAGQKSARIEIPVTNAPVPDDPAPVVIVVNSPDLKSPLTVGDTFTQTISIENRDFQRVTLPLSAWQMDVVFNPLTLEVIEVTAGDFLESDGVDTHYTEIRSKGKISVGQARDYRSGIALAPGDEGTLLTINFKVLAVAEEALGIHNVRLQSSGLVDRLSYSILVTDLSVGVTSQSPPEDVNQDGTVDILDLVMVASNIGADPHNSHADVNGDGFVNVLDLITIYTSEHWNEPALKAPSVSRNVGPDTIQSWIDLARIEDDGSAIFDLGTANLEALIASRIPTETRLLLNYPNPFNPETWIPYQLSEPSDVSVSIYSVNGHLVRRLDLGHQSAGVYQSRNRAAYWDGRNAFGERVASGLYFYTLTAGDFRATRKMLIRK